MTSIRKFKENPVEVFFFYLACVVGIATSIFVIARGGVLPIPGWPAVLTMLLGYVYLAIDLPWWFGDHPEE